MHRYQPRVHLIRRLETDARPIVDLEREQFRTYVFPETVFTAVTAYQNQLVSRSFTFQSTRCKTNFINSIIYLLIAMIRSPNSKSIATRSPKASAIRLDSATLKGELKTSWLIIGLSVRKRFYGVN